MDQTNNFSPPEAKLHFLDYWRVIRIRKAIIITVFLITVIIATLVTFILPEKFASTTRIKVESDVTDISPLNGGLTPGMSMFDPYFIQTTFEIMQSQIVLSNVIANLNLNEEWGKKYNNGETLKTTETMEYLKNSIKLEPVRNTKLIAITVYSDDKNEAARIANAIAAAYKNYRMETRQDMAFKGLEAYQDQYLEESNQIEKVQANVEKLRTDLGIIGDFANATEPTPTVSKEQLSTYYSQKIEGQRIYNDNLTKLDELKSYDKEKLRNVLPGETHDDELNSELSQLFEAQRKIAALKVDYNPTNNFDVIRVQALIDTLNTQIDNRVDGIMAGLETDVKAKKAWLDTLVDSLNEAEEKDRSEAIKYQPYYDGKSKLQQMQAQNNLLYTKISMERADADLPTSSMVTVTDPAEPGKSPVSPKIALNIILGVVFGLIMGIGLAFFIEYLDTSVKTIDDVERTFQAPVVGVIPQNIGYLLEEGPESKHAEAYRVLRTNLLFSRKDEMLSTIVVVSAGAGEGKSTTTINLATVFAQAGSRVLIVDSDLRRPTLHKLFKVANNLGLTNYLLKQNTLAEIVQTTSVPNLDFMASGKLPNSSMGILGSAQMKEMISELKQRYDFVFFDSPPILGVSDASILASEVDLVMQVIQYRRYPQPMTIRAKQMIEKVGGNFVGIVLNNINMSQDEGYYYYSGYYHDYYYSRNPEQQEAEVKETPANSNETENRLKQKY
jgi:succinoglycan biosynthesis transport protein ExoP